MSTQSKGTQRIYDKFRSNDDQINFLMSEKGEMSLDRQIVKMMKDMDANEIIEFANQFFKFKQNQCSSLQMLINSELSIREGQGSGEKHNENDVKNIGFDVVDNNDNERQKCVSILDSLPNIMKQMSKLKEVLEENDNNNTQQQQQVQQQNNDDKIDFQQQIFEEYVPKISPDEEYLTSTKNDGQYISFDRLPSYLLLEATQNQQTNSKQVKSQTNKQRSNIIKTTIKQQKPGMIDVQRTKRQQRIHSNLLNQRKDHASQEIQQNQHQIQSQIPTTVQQDEQQDFEQLSRTHLQDNKFKIIYNNGDQYEGELENEMKNGWGDYHYNTGQRYQGFFIDDQIHGYGEYSFLSGASYEGDWSSGMKHGIGMLKFSNGDVYQGQFVRDHFHGKGTYNYANGDVFTGIWKNGQKHGKGKLQTFDGSLQIGNWLFDKFQI